MRYEFVLMRYDYRFDFFWHYTFDKTPLEDPFEFDLTKYDFRKFVVDFNENSKHFTILENYSWLEYSVYIPCISKNSDTLFICVI